MNDARLLIVGSGSGIARGWIEPLREAGVNISAVADGASALRHLDLLEPELVLLDLQRSGALDGRLVRGGVGRPRPTAGHHRPADLPSRRW